VRNGERRSILERAESRLIPATSGKGGKGNELENWSDEREGFSILIKGWVTRKNTGRYTETRVTLRLGDRSSQ